VNLQAWPREKFHTFKQQQSATAAWPAHKAMASTLREGAFDAIRNYLAKQPNQTALLADIVAHLVSLGLIAAKGKRKGLYGD
jgi:hypothetical protein